MPEKKSLSISSSLFLLLLLIFYTGNSVNALVINSDGTVDVPSYVSQKGDVYVVSTDAGFLEVNRDNIIVDGDGHKLDKGTVYAVGLMNVNNVTLKNFIITGTVLQVGILLQNSSNCTITGNLISKTKTINPKFWATSAINIAEGGSHMISKNNISDNGIGILLGSRIPCTICENSISNNTSGLVVSSSYDNIIYSNNFANNYRHFSDMGASYPPGPSISINFWDNGLIGNYWSNYSGQDLNGDNIGDSPHVIFENNQDNYPLIMPVKIVTIPEFSSWIIIPIFLVATLAVIQLRKKMKTNR